MKKNNQQLHIDTDRIPRKGCMDMWNAFMVKEAIFTHPSDIPICPCTADKSPSDLISYVEAKAMYKKEMDAGNHDFFHDAFLAEERANRIGRLCTVFDPADNFFFVDVDNGGVFCRVVVAHDFDKTPVTRRTAVRDDYAIERLPFGAHSIESDFYHDLTTFRVWLNFDRLLAERELRAE